MSTVSGKTGGVHKLVRCGLNPDAAAFAAARLMIEYAVPNDEGGDLMAPAEVLEMVPVHLRMVPKQKSGDTDERKY